MGKKRFLSCLVCFVLLLSSFLSFDVPSLAEMSAATNEPENESTAGLPSGPMFQEITPTPFASEQDNEIAQEATAAPETVIITPTDTPAPTDTTTPMCTQKETPVPSDTPAPTDTPAPSQGPVQSGYAAITKTQSPVYAKASSASFILAFLEKDDAVYVSQRIPSNSGDDGNDWLFCHFNTSAGPQHGYIRAKNLAFLNDAETDALLAALHGLGNAAEHEGQPLPFLNCEIFTNQTDTPAETLPAEATPSPEATQESIPEPVQVPGGDVGQLVSQTPNPLDDTTNELVSPMHDPSLAPTQSEATVTPQAILLNGFADLSANSIITVPAGTLPEQVPFPATVQAISIGSVLEIPVTWTRTALDDVWMDGGSYLFSPVLPGEYALAEGVALPLVTVAISQPDSELSMPKASGLYDFSSMGWCNPISPMKATGVGSFDNPTYKEKYDLRHAGFDFVDGSGASQKIYALDDGVVTHIYRTSAASKNDSVLYIRHKTNEGLEFTAVYGHTYALSNLSEGSTVKKGVQIGITKFYNVYHLHLGINVKSSFSRWGTTSVNTDPTSLGWRDPSVWLLQNAASGQANAPTPTPIPTPIPAIEPTSITLSYSGITIAVDQSADTVKAAVYPANVTNPSVAWSSSAPSVARVDSNGIITGAGTGTATITATASNGITASCAVTVVKRGKGVMGIALNKSSAAVDEGKSLQLSAKFTPRSPANKSVVWISSNPSVATINGKGKVIGVTPGTVVITAIASSGVTAVCAITVRSLAVTAISLNKASLVVKMGRKAILRATLLPRNARYKAVTWVSSNTSVAVVSPTGKVTAVGHGTATITAVAHNGVSAYCTVTVP